MAERRGSRKRQATKDPDFDFELDLTDHSLSDSPPPLESDEEFQPVSDLLETPPGTKQTTRKKGGKGRKERGGGRSKERRGRKEKGKGRKKKGQTVETQHGEPAPTAASTSERGSNRGQSRGRGSRGRGTGRGTGRNVGRGGLQLEAEQVQRLIEFQNQSQERIKDLVGKASPDMLRELVLELASQQPGLVLDITERLSSQSEDPAPPQQSSESAAAEEPESATSQEQPPKSPSPTPTPSPPPPSPPPQQQPRPDWCVCGHCQEMPDPIEDICCRRDPELCTATTPEMRALVLHPGILQLQQLYRGDIFALPRRPAEQRGPQRQQAAQNKSFRHAAYTQFILWQHGRLGHRNRRVVPSCCALKIREAFPDPHGLYVGFRPAPLA